MARWSGWGALPAVFDPKAAKYERFAPERGELLELLSAEEYAAAERSTINAHYTDAAYVQAIWEAVGRLGFRGGQVLEPGCGSGNFIGLAPPTAEMVGVELEPVSAALAGAIYGQAQIRNESFAETRSPEGQFDLVVGNVPFGNIQLHDPRHNSGEHSIHNHFIIKSLHLTRPGGLVAVLTSRYTMDATNPAARREMGELADLVGAVRLPTAAHRRAAGTDVVTDVLILRRREEGGARHGAPFEQNVPLALSAEHEPLRINEYFQAHPEHVLGELRLDQGDGGRAELGVAGDAAAGPALDRALRSITDRALEVGLMMSPAAPSERPRAIALVAASDRRPDGHLVALEDGTFTRRESGIALPYQPPPRQAEELRALLRLRDVAVTLLEAEAQAVDDTADMAQLRQQLNRQYDAYARTYGPLNRFTWRGTGRVDATTGEPKRARIRPPQGGFRDDPFAMAVLALEHFDDSTLTATKATIFRERVVARRAPRLGADTPADALALCLDAYGEVRLVEVARLLGVAEREARQQLGALVYDEPGTRRLVAAAEYLSGNVRLKHRAALVAAVEDPTFAPNVPALAAVLPRDLAPDEIDAKLGAAWIDKSYVRQFLVELLEDESVYVEHPGGAMWTVKAGSRYSVLATNTWGTERYSAIDVAESLLEQRTIRIYDTDREGVRTFNATETLAATEKAREMGDRFREWVWEEPERATRLAAVYNETFNAIQLRSYDGAKLALPGLARAFSPRPHQVAAVARIINEPATGLFHEVGAGKTAEMVMGAMELRRLGLVAKPAVVVPNHMLEQFTREWLQLYPQAKVLAATKEDLDKDRRRLFVAKAATGEWDGIVMTRSAFQRIPMSPEVQRKYVTREVEQLQEMLLKAKAEDARFSVKRLQKALTQAEERLKKQLDTEKDPGITFEQLGVDYLFVDEAHSYKNLRTVSHIPGMAVEGSQRATDLHMKLEYLRERSARVATLATATPIANSMGEAFTMQRYLRPDLLEAAGVGDFDTWAATFGETTTAIEVAPDGTGMRMSTRFAKFRNVPELLQLWRVSADIKTAEDLDLPVPALAVRPGDSQRAAEIVVVKPSEPLRTFMTELARRAERVRGGGVDPAEDNLLKISSDGRAAGLDVRLVGGHTDEHQKVNVAAERIAGIYKATQHNEYLGADGLPHPLKGALQLVFSDLGTPKEGWSVYEELRTQLVERGVPRQAVRFMHDAKNDREKAELFAACRSGHVGVLVGSTERMGVGTNVQLRAVALHDLDCPWRPADLAQRQGRILRQGNANEEVSILRYVTEGAFDAYLWQTVTRKAGFIAQVMRGRLDVREIEDIGEAALSYNEVKALATGNPLLLEHAKAHADVQRLERLERAHAKTQDSLRWTERHSLGRLAELRQQADEAEAAIPNRPPLTAEAFSLTVRGRSIAKPAEANEILRRELERVLVSWGDSRAVVAQLRGTNLLAGRLAAGYGVAVELAGVPGSALQLGREEIDSGRIVQRLEHRWASLEALRDSCRGQIDRVASEVGRARAEIGKPFRQAAQLEGGRARLRQLDEQLQALAVPAAPTVPAPTPPEVDAGSPAAAAYVDVEQAGQRPGQEPGRIGGLEPPETPGPRRGPRDRARGGLEV